jgi:hypothetical protein
MSDIPEIVEQLKQATDYQINRKILQEKIQTDLHFTHNGGLFRATPELIAFVHAWRSTNEIWSWGGGESMYMEDTYDNPIHIENCAEFYRIACEHYQRVMNTWHQQHAELRKLRKI